MSNRVYTDAAYFAAQDMWTHLANEGDENAHSHTFYEIFYIINGPIKHNLNGTVSTLNTGDLCVVFPGEYHYFIRNDKTLTSTHRDIIIKVSLFEKCCNFLSEDLLKNISEKHRSEFWHIPSEELHLLDKSFNMFTLNIFAANDKKIEEEKILCFRLLKYFLSTSSVNTPSNYPLWLIQLLTRFHSPQNLKEGLPIILSTSHYHPVYMCRVFKKYVGMTMSDYLLTIRLHHASNLLLTTDNTISDIAESLGFQSIPYFNKTFKKTFGMPPSEYRKNNLQK